MTMHDTTPLPPDEEPFMLDADLQAAISAAQAAEPLASETAARIKHRLFERIAASEQAQVAVTPESGSWRPFLPGIAIKVLHERAGVMSYLLRMQPGSVIPSHKHPHEEECVVLEGSVMMGDLVVGAGGFVLERADTLHPPLRTINGATIYLRGASPRAEHLV